jgi:hypothetical protein
MLATFDGVPLAGVWKLKLLNNVSGEDIQLATWELQIATQPLRTSVTDDVASRASWVGSPRPNPFNPMTTIPLHVGRGEHVRFRIYDVAGRAVRTLVDEPLVEGSYGIQWDGRSDVGLPVSSGVYFYRVEIGDRSFKGKAIVLK